MSQAQESLGEQAVDAGGTGPEVQDCGQEGDRKGGREERQGTAGK